jgi:hypothetical protein
VAGVDGMIPALTFLAQGMSYNDSLETEKTEFAKENKMLETAKMLVDIAV